MDNPMADDKTPAAAAPARPAKPKPGKPINVRALRAHTQPGTLTYRAEGDEFVHRGELYKHVEEVKQKPAPEIDEESEDN